MNHHRRWALIACAAALVLVFGVLLPASAPAQNDFEDRIAGLEDQVADLENRVSILERSMDARAGKPGSDADTPPASDENLVISGEGTVVSDKFTLAAGRYRVHATVSATGFTGFIVHVYLPDDEAYLFNELIDEAGEWTASAVLTVRTGGSVFIEVSNTDAPWSLEFESF